MAAPPRRVTPTPRSGVPAAPAPWSPHHWTLVGEPGLGEVGWRGEDKADRRPLGRGWHILPPEGKGPALTHIRALLADQDADPVPTSGPPSPTDQVTDPQNLGARIPVTQAGVGEVVDHDGDAVAVPAG